MMQNISSLINRSPCSQEFDPLPENHTQLTTKVQTQVIRDKYRINGKGPR